MPTFTYTARDHNGAPVNGTMVADSTGDVAQRLRTEGKYLTSAQAVEPDDPAQANISDRGIKISRSDLIQFSNQLSIMVETGVTLSEALDCIAHQTEKPIVKQLVEDVAQVVQAGSDFSTALSRHPRSFPRLYVALIRASEKTGMMGKLLNRATAYLRDEAETIRRVKGALTYPAIMLSFALLTTIFLLAFVLPRFTTIYAAKSAALPLPTRILMHMSNFVTGNWIALLSCTVLTVIGGWWYLRTDAGARVWHYVQLNIPLLGPLFRKLHLARTMRMVGTMAGAGVNLVDCVTTAQELSGNSYYRDLWAQVSDQIQHGKQLSEPLFANPLVPRSVAQMIHSGEKSGKVSFVMEQVSGFAEQELKEQIANLTRYIEPAMIIIMGLIIGGVALAMLLPIFTISRVVAS